MESTKEHCIQMRSRLCYVGRHRPVLTSGDNRQTETHVTFAVLPLRGEVWRGEGEGDPSMSQ